MRSGLVYAVIGTILVGVVISSIFWFVNLPIFKFDDVRISAMTSRKLLHADNSMAKKELLESERGGFFTANLGQIRRSFEQRPWVRSANIRREWPNKLIVEVEEHQPLGLWGGDGQILSVQGEVFVANLAEAEDEVNLFQFTGPSGSEREVVTQFAEFQKWFGEMSLKPVATELSVRRNWRVTLSNGLVIDLGRDDGRGSIRKRFERFRVAYKRIESGIGGGIRYVDLRYANGIAVQPNVPTPMKR